MSEERVKDREQEKELEEARLLLAERVAMNVNGNL
jgi:hypothetical protein